MPKKPSKQPSSSSSLPTPAPTTTTIPSILSDTLPLPKLIVFDLDYTLWPFWVDTHVNGRLTASPSAPGGTAATDRTGEVFRFYADVPAILATLAALPKTKLGVASRTAAPDLARDMLKLLHVPHHKKEGTTKRALEVFDAGLQIYPGCKVAHMQKLQRDNGGVAFEDVLFFDDEVRNRDTEALGLTMWLVRDGVCWTEIEAGVREWRKRRGVGGSGEGEGA